MKSKKVIALGLASCVLLSQPLYAAQPLKGNTKPRGPMKGKPAVVAVQKDQVKEVRFTTKKITSTEDGLVLDICIPVIEGFTDIKFQKKLNDTIEKQIMKDKKDMEQEVKKYLHDAKKQDLKISPYKLQVDYDIKSSGDILSFTITTGVSYGNNSMERVDSYNIDEKGNQLLQLKDLFKEGSDYKKIIVAEIEKQIKAQEDNKVVYFKGNKGYKNISATQAFYIQGDSVVITFPKYSIASGSVGTPQFKIPFSLLKEVLKEDLKQSVSIIAKTTYSKNDYLIQRIRVPEVQGLTNKKFQEELNKKIKSHLPKQIEELEKEAKKHMEEAKKKGIDAYPYEIHVDYDVKSIGEILSFTVTTSEFRGGTSAPRIDYYNIDTKENKILSLSDLFIKGENYKKVIDKEISKQIKEQVDAGKGTYFEGEDGFKGIASNHDFYLQNDNLVICFPKYSIAPGFMGTPEFKIPFSMLKDLLK